MPEDRDSYKKTKEVMARLFNALYYGLEISVALRGRLATDTADCIREAISGAAESKAAIGLRLAEREADDG